MKPHKHSWTNWDDISTLSPLWYSGWRKIQKCSGCLQSRRIKDGGVKPAEQVVALVDILQSPLSKAPDVPKCRVGYVTDEADGLFWVDFDAPYGVVCCSDDEVL